MSRYVWPVDPAFSRLAFAFADLLSDSIVVESLTTHSHTREGERLGLLDRQVRIYARQRVAEFPPAVVWVEQPSGRFPSPQLAYCVGVTMAALFEQLRCPVWSLPSGKWKKASIGVGNATKTQVKAWVDQQCVSVANQDEADAVAIAFAGRRMLHAQRWDVVA